MYCLQSILIQIVPTLLSTEVVSYNKVSNARETAIYLLLFTVVVFVATIKDFAEGGYHLAIKDLPWTKLIVCLVLVIVTLLAFVRSNVLKKQYDEYWANTWMGQIESQEPSTHFGEITW